MPRITQTSPAFPEGLSTVVLAVGVVACAGFCVQTAEWTQGMVPIGVVAVAAAVFGAVLAKARIPDSLAHILSIGVGAAASLGVVAVQAPVLGDRLRDRVRPLARLVVDWYLGVPIPDGTENLLVSILMGIVVWLVGYLAVWTLFRRGWILVTVVLPAFLILVTVGYAPEPDRRFLALYAALCIPLLARFHFYTRQRDWDRRRLAGSPTMASRFLVSGVVVACLATLISARAPSSLSQEVFQPLAGQVSSSFVRAQERATDWLQRTVGQQAGGSNGGAGSFTRFDDAFSIGGPLELSDQPQALVSADTAPYLIAQRYDSYSGRGWSSLVDDTFRSEGADGRVYAPEMSFRAGQEVVQTGAVSTGRAPVTVIVTPLGLPGQRLLTVQSYLTANIDTSVRMSWTQLENEPFILREGSITALPADLQGIAALLVEADLRGESGDAGPYPTDAGLRQRLDEERDQLRPLFRILSWTADADGRVDTMFVTGQIPNYDDVEAVLARTGIESGAAYAVTGSASGATARELAGAGNEYPEWVSRRYLSLPPTVTPRTAALARSITSAASGPFEQARAIEAYLRDSIVYDERVEAPPEGTDIVDYVLFERRRGYCEYYASAMSVMLRSLGVPARVAVGFFPGDWDEERGGYLYRQRNAHAWVEVFFPGYGWIPFEPTASRPLIDQGQAEPPLERTLDVEAEIPPVEPVATPAPPGPARAEAPPPAPTVVQEDGGPSPWVIAGSGAAVLILGLIAAGWWMWAAPLRGLSLAASLYRRLGAVGRLIGLDQSASRTPREFERAFGEAAPQTRPHVQRIVDAYEVDQFGAGHADRRIVSRAFEAWRDLRPALWRAVLRPRRR